ncbi:MAG: TRAP transporter large permease [Burkholderiales bacterium]
MRKELWFGFAMMAIVIIICVVLLPAPSQMSYGHLGLLMLGLLVVTIMLGFPTAFTLMGMGVIFGWIAFGYDTTRILDLMVQRAYAVMANDVLIAVPLFVFMGYLVERANLIEKLFKSMHLALAAIPGSLAVATIATCALFSTATGIVGAVVTLMGLLAFPAMLRANYSIQVSAGCITAGGCLGILIPPSVLLIVYGATAGVSVVQLYAGAFFPGLMLAALYVGYVMVLATLRPRLMPPLSEADRRVELPQFAKTLSANVSRRALPALIRGFRGDVPSGAVARNLVAALLPALACVFVLALIYRGTTAPTVTYSTEGLVELGGDYISDPGLGLEEPPGTVPGAQEPPGAEPAKTPDAVDAKKAEPKSPVAPQWFWITLAVVAAVVLAFYWFFDFARLEVFKMLLVSFFPLAMLIVAVLGSIVFGLATPAEAAAMGAFGGYALAAVYALFNKFQGRVAPRLVVWGVFWLPVFIAIGWLIAFENGMTVTPVPKWFGWLAAIAIGAWSVIAYQQAGLRSEVNESVFLTAKTTAMVCWLFVGSSIFSASFALLGGQELIERWVLSLDMSPLEFMLLSQVIIFLLGWPLEWTEIIVIFMPIFVPLLSHFQIDPLFFGLMVALNLQTAFLSPPVAMAAFYLKGVAPPHVRLGQIFSGMMPFMVIQVIAMVLLYTWPQIGLWVPNALYK